MLHLVRVEGFADGPEEIRREFDSFLASVWQLGIHEGLMFSELERKAEHYEPLDPNNELTLGGSKFGPPFVGRKVVQLTPGQDELFGTPLPLRQVDAGAQRLFRVMAIDAEGQEFDVSDAVIVLPRRFALAGENAAPFWRDWTTLEMAIGAVVALSRPYVHRLAPPGDVELARDATEPYRLPSGSSSGSGHSTYSLTHEAVIGRPDWGPTIVVPGVGELTEDSLADAIVAASDALARRGIVRVQRSYVLRAAQALGSRASDVAGAAEGITIEAVEGQGAAFWELVATV